MLTLVGYRPIDSLLQAVPEFQYIETPIEKTKNKATKANGPYLVQTYYGKVARNLILIFGISIYLLSLIRLYTTSTLLISSLIAFIVLEWYYIFCMWINRIYSTSVIAGFPFLLNPFWRWSAVFPTCATGSL